MSTDTKTVYQLDRHHCYLCTTTADRDPLDENNWLIPAGCVETAPPQTGKNQAAQWQYDSQTWRIIPDYRGQTAYRTNIGQHDGIAADTVTEPGELPKGLTIEPPPGSLHTWDGKAWVLDAETAAALKQAQQEEMWTRIKAKRETQRYGGTSKASANGCTATTRAAPNTPLCAPCPSCPKKWSGKPWTTPLSP